MTDKPTERAPLLSEKERDEIIDAAYADLSMVNPDSGYLNAGTEARLISEWYEAKISSGELRVVKKAEDDCGECSLCRCVVYGGYLFCPGCGARIVK